MSDHAHAGAADAHGEHHSVYEGTPASEPGPGEPATPGWLTLLGISLVLAAMLAWVATRPDAKTRAELTPSSSAAAVAAAAPAAPTPSARPDRAMPPGMRPGTPGMPSMIPSGFLPRAAPSGARPLRPAGEFAIQPGEPGGTTKGTPRRQRPPAAAQ
jgi:hypothetical protein